MKIERRIVMSKEIARRFLEAEASPDHRLSVFVDPGEAEGFVSSVRQRVASAAAIRFVNAFDQVHFHSTDESALQEIDDAAMEMQLETSGVQ